MISDEEQCSLDVEIQSLKAIFAEELEVNRSNDDGGAVQSLVLQMSPESSKGEKQQFVRFEVVMEIPPEYPQAIPKITLRNVRGLSEEAQARTKEYMVNRAKELSGNAMLFELIQVAKEQLTSENTPSVPCSICLFSFDAEDSFSRTPCFHFFHTHCLAKHVQHTFAQKDLSEDKAALTETSKESQLDVLCPVCRLSIPFKESDPEQFPIPRESLKEQEEIVITPELREMQEKMAALYSEQLAKGSIIDLEAEKNKFFIEISNTPDIPVLTSTSLSPSQGKPTSDTPAMSDGTTSKSSASEHLRKHYDGNSRKQGSSRNYEKKPRPQPRKLASKTEISEINGWEEKEESETERPTRTQPHNQYQRRENRKYYDRTDGESKKPLDDGDQKGTEFLEEDMKGEGNQQQGERKNRGRRQFQDRKSKPKKNAANEMEKSHGTNVENDGEQEDIVECERHNEDFTVNSEANANTDNRVQKKKKPRRPRNFQPGAYNQESGVTNADMAATGENQGDESESRSPGPSSKFRSIQNNRRNDYTGQRGYRQNNYRSVKRFYSERQSINFENPNENSPTTKERNEDGSHVDNVEDQSAETPVNSGKTGENRYRNNNYKSRSNFYGKYRARDTKSEEQGDNGAEAFKDDSCENAEKGDENVDYPRSHARKSYQSGSFSKQREGYNGRNRSTHYPDNGNANIEADGHSYRNRDEENWTSQSQRGNLRFQKSYSNESETSESQKDVENSGKESQSQSTEINRPRYRINHNNMRRPNYSDQIRTRNSYRSSELLEGSETNASRQYNRDNYRNPNRRRPKYGNRDQQDVPQADSTTEEAAICPSEQSDTHRKYQSNRDHFEHRNYRRDNWSTNYAGRDRNRYQRYHGQHSQSSFVTPVQPEITALSPRPEPTSMKQTIKPFTSMYNSATPDAQPLPCIPPPF